MHALPFILALLAALVLTPQVLARLSEAGVVRENYRGIPLPVPLGLVIVPAGLLALIVLALLARLGNEDVYPDNFGLVLLFVPGVALLGFIDDVLSAAGRGWRGHGSDVLKGVFSTGALKAACTLGLALLVASSLPGSDAEFLLAAAVLVLATNVSNLLDLRPGRSVKAFVLLGLGLTLSTQNTEALAAMGIFAAPVLVVGFYDLRERAMLGDTGSNVIGALAGLWMVLTLDTNGQLVALVVLLAVNIFGEFRSISAVIEKVPG
jgi:UDP-GlcNAc:undecaprenyl-phosphate GlcNAc-1-phosphate transferase